MASSYSTARVDPEQLKVRGITGRASRDCPAALQQAAGVEQAEVIGLPAADGELSLLAYVTGAALDEEALRHELESRLPDYMVPSAIVVLEGFPLTANGKVDRKAALPAPGRGGRMRRRPVPRGRRKRRCCAIWSRSCWVWSGCRSVGG